MSTRIRLNRVSPLEKKAYEILRVVIMCVFVLYGFMQRQVVFEKITGSYFVVGAMLLLAAVGMAWNFFRLHTLFKASYTWVFIAFIVWTGICSLVWFRYGIYTNAVLISYLLIEVLIFYQFDADRGVAALTREFKAVCIVISIASFLTSLVTLFLYFTYVGYHYVDNAGATISQGYWSIFRRAWGFYVETNFQGIQDLIVLFVSFIFFAKSKKVIGRILWGVNIVIHYLCMTILGSRGTIVAYCGAVFVFAVFLVQRWLLPRNWTALKSWVVRFCAGILAMAVAFGIFTGVKAVMPLLQFSITNSMSSGDRKTVTSAVERVYALAGKEVTFLALPSASEKPDEFRLEQIEEIERLDIENKEDYSNGRFHVWKDALYLFSKYPIFGMSPGNREAIVNELDMDLCEEIMDGDSLLSGYLEVLVGSGIIGFALYGIFLGLCIRKLLRYDQRYNRFRFELGCLLAAIAAMMLFSVFTIELFYVKSAITYLFWIVLGYAMALLNTVEKEAAETQGTAAFLTDTPYQVVNAVNFVSSAKDLRADIYIYDQFAAAGQIAERLRETGLFEDVVLIRKYKTHGNVIRKLARLFQLAVPGRTLCRYAGRNLKNKNYKTVYLSFFTAFTDTVRMAYPYAEFCQYEDGIGSYACDDLEHAFRAGFFDFINRYFFCDRLSYQVKTLYLHHPECYRGGAFAQIEALPPVRDFDTLKTVFDYTPNAQYQTHKIVYLTQPLGETAIGAHAKQTEDALLSAVGENALLRIHPRQTAETYAGYTVDSRRNLWELECAGSITDEHVLIGAFSTAQFTPKMLYDKEPTVIFTYKLYGNALKDADRTVAMLRNMYRQPQRVIVAESLSDLQRLLDDLRREQSR